MYIAPDALEDTNSKNLNYTCDMFIIQSGSKSKMDKSFGWQFKVQFYDMGYRYHCSRVRVRVNEIREDCSEKLKCSPSSEFTIVLWIGSGTVRSS